MLRAGADKPWCEAKAPARVWALLCAHFGTRDVHEPVYCHNRLHVFYSDDVEGDEDGAPGVVAAYATHGWRS